MKYYRVKPEADQHRIYNANNTKYLGFLIANELITPGELKNMWRENIPHKYVEVVEIKKTNTYFCFGARFEIKANA